MAFKRFMLLFLLFSIMAFADGEKNFRVSLNQYKVGDIVSPIANMAITVQGTMVSQKMTFPLKKNVLYLRHKVSPKEYQWIGGAINIPNYQKLHAFSLKKNHLKAYEVAQMRLYAVQKEKAFKDEMDIYFDRDYLYSPRVPKLFFFKNGRWQQLKEDPIPGVIKIDNKDDDFEFSNINLDVEDTSKVIFPVEPGAYSFVFDASWAVPEVDIGRVKSGEVLVFKPILVKRNSRNSFKFEFSLTESSIRTAKTLEETELLYDAFLKEFNESDAKIDTSEFVKEYPKLKDASKIGLAAEDPQYTDYVARYKLVREDAKRKWVGAKMPQFELLDSLLRQKLDSLQQLPLRGNMPASTVGLDSVLTIKFGKNGDRYDVSWKGTFIGVPSDSVYAWMIKGQPGVRLYMTLQNNKPVWLYKEGVVSGRFQYRYTLLEAEINGTVYKGEGTFILPPHILETPEVQEWLHPKVIESAPAPVKDSVIISSSSSSVPQSSSSAFLMKIINDPLRGSLALIDSGTFRFEGRIVNMSPFAIMTTEMTQELFEKAMLKEDSAKRIKDKSTFFHPQKPVHNINWYNARKVCEMNGGDLPTEAQWEFAGLAGNNEGAIWILDSIPSPGDYAVYRENSYVKNKQDESYGPQQVKSKKPNDWGLYDMSGNVAEWTRDKYFMFSFWVESSNPTGALFGSSKIYKGGSWKDKEKLLNLSENNDEDPRYWSDWIGFRCVYPIDTVKK